MVRLRSERWFSAQGQGRSQALVSARTSGTRRLISLCFLLALVVLLMQKAADPKYVSSAFRSVGAPLEPARTSLPEPQTGRDTPSAATPGKWALTCGDLVPRLLADANEHQIELLSSVWFGISLQRRPSPADLEVGMGTASAVGSSLGLNDLRASSLAQLEDLAAGLPADDQIWLEQLERFRGEWIIWWNSLEQGLGSDDRQVFVPRPQDDRTATEFELDTELRQSVSAYLDERLIKSLTDAAPWSPRETIAFWRLIQRGEESGGRRESAIDVASELGGDMARGDSEPGGSLTPRISPRISTLQLESEAAIFKGKWIRFCGSVRRLEFVERTNEALGLNGYWLAWVRGDDNSAQPVAIYGTANEFKDIEQALSLEQGFPEIEVRAIVGKRLAYASQAGVQVAPTLFAAALEVLKLPAEPQSQGVPSTWKRDFALALCGGAALAGLICNSILRGRREVTRRKTRLGRSSLLLMCCLVGGGFHRSGLAQALPPPWAEETSSQDDLQKLVGTRLQTALQPEAVDKLQRFLDANTREFPVETLQAIHVLNQVGWRRVMGTGLTSQVGEVQLRTVSISGIVSAAELVVLTKDQRAWFQRGSQDQLYLLSVQVDLSEQTVEPQSWGASAADSSNQTELAVLCQQIPQRWRDAGKLRQPIHISGFGISESIASSPMCILAGEVEWVLPAGNWSNFLPSIPSNLRVLGQLGWNLSFADQVAANNQQPLRENESQAFYTMLNLLDSAAAVGMISQSVGQLGPVDSLAAPAISLGQAVRWPVRLVSCSVVEVDSEAERLWLGSGQYFQFDGFVDMGNRRVRYQIDSTRPADDVVFEREFPITLVMKSTSEFTPRHELSGGNQSWTVGRFAEVEGCFYRLWSFESEFLQQKKTDARQAAPLVMATRLQPSWPPARPATATEIGWFGYALCLATLVILAAILTSVAKSQRSVRRN